MKIMGEKKTETIFGLVCDSCGFNTETDDPHGFEKQEFLSWSDTCGYGNIPRPDWAPDKPYGDRDQISVDLCQKCVWKLLGTAIRIERL
jgi:transcription elongation factor Elf1